MNLISISEESGTLEENLEFLSQQLSKDYALRKKIQGAMFYPVLILFAGSAIGLFISLFVLPQLVDFFESLDVELPLSTKILLGFASVMKNHGLLVVSLFIGTVTLFYITIHSRLAKPYWHAFVLKTPLFGKLAQYGQLARLSRNLGTLLKSGAKLITSTSYSTVKLANIFSKAFLPRLILHFRIVRKGLSLRLF